MVNEKGMEHHGVANGKPVGEQGVSSKDQGGKSVSNVHNPKGVEPKSHGSIPMPLTPTDGVKPVVGK